MSSEEAVEKLKCRCEEPGLWQQCASRATQEDMFCDHCRKFGQAMTGAEYDPKMKNAYLGMHIAYHRYGGFKYIPGVQSSSGGNYAPYEPR